MNYRFYSAGILIFLLTGCASNKELKRIDALRRETAWPTIRAAAENEIARREGNTDWSHSAYYSPQEHTNGVWKVIASGAYPLNKFGDSVDLLIRESGEVLSYVPRIPSAHSK